MGLWNQVDFELEFQLEVYKLFFLQQAIQHWQWPKCKPFNFICHILVSQKKSIRKIAWNFHWTSDANVSYFISWIFILIFIALVFHIFFLVFFLLSSVQNICKRVWHTWIHFLYVEYFLAAKHLDFTKEKLDFRWKWHSLFFFSIKYVFHHINPIE